MNPVMATDEASARGTRGNQRSESVCIGENNGDEMINTSDNVREMMSSADAGDECPKPSMVVEKDTCNLATLRVGSVTDDDGMESVTDDGDSSGRPNCLTDVANMPNERENQHQVSTANGRRLTVDRKSLINLGTYSPGIGDVDVNQSNESMIETNARYCDTSSEQKDSNENESYRSPKRTKKFRFSIFSRQKQKSPVNASNNNNNKPSQCSVHTISDTVPEVRHESILCQTGHGGNSEKTPTFFMPKSAKRREKKHLSAHGTTVPPLASNHGTSAKEQSARHLCFSSLYQKTQKQSKNSKSPKDSEVVTDDSCKKILPSAVKSRETKDDDGPVTSAKTGRGSADGKYLERLPERFQKWWQADDTIEGKEIRNTVIVGVTFQLIFTAHFAIQNLQSSLHDEQSKGVTALGCLYASSIFSSIFAPSIIGVLGTKGCLVLAWITHMMYTLAQFYPTWLTLVPSSVLLGALMGPTWTAQGLYVSACAFSFSKRSPHSPYTILSRFNGLFFTLYETRQILGNLLSSAVLRNGVGNASEEIIFKYCGPRDCPAAENVTDIADPDRVVVDVMLGIYLALQIVALVLTVMLVTPLSRSEWSSHAPVRETLTSWLKTLVRTRMWLLVPFMIFQAMEQGILLSEYTKSFISCPIGIHMVGFVMATHGSTSAVFVFIFSRLARRTGRFPLFIFAAVISLALLIVLYDWTPGSDQEALIFLFPVLWGIGAGIWQTQTNSMLAVVFWDRKESAFANYQTWRALGYTFIFSFHSLLCVSTKIAITIAFLVVGMVLYTIVEIHSHWKERVRAPKNIANKVNTASSSPNPVSDSDLPSYDDEHRTLSVPHPLEFEFCVSPPSVSEEVESGSASSSFKSFKFEDSDVEKAGRVTVDGTYLRPYESAYLDNDLRRYGIVPATGSRPLAVGQMFKGNSEADDRWTLKDETDSWSNGSYGQSSQRWGQPHTWHDDVFQDEGELRVLRTNGEVFVF